MDQTQVRDFLTGEDVRAAQWNELLRSQLANLQSSVEAQVKVLDRFAGMIDKAHPHIECGTTPADGTSISGLQLVQFTVGTRQVRAYWLMIQNNSTSSVDILFRLNAPANPGAFVLTPGQTYEGWVAACRAVGIYVPSGAIILNAPDGLSIQAMTTAMEAGVPD